MMFSVSHVGGTAGNASTGRLSGNAPWSPTVGTATPAATVNTVRPVIATSGAGTARVSRGSPTITTRPAASSP
jgi:hypothetical protein